MERMTLTESLIERLKRQDFKSVIIFGASNPAELKDRQNTQLMASKELVKSERVTEKSFHVAIDDPVLKELCAKMELYIDVP